MKHRGVLMGLYTKRWALWTTGVCLLALAGTTTAGAQSTNPESEATLEAQIAALQKAAEQARKDARTAQESAAKAEALIAELRGKQATPPCDAAGSKAPLLDCKAGLERYVVHTEKTEAELLAALRQMPPVGGKPATGGPTPKSLASSTGDFRGSIAASKDGTNVSLTNSFPLSRRKSEDRIIDGERQQRAIARDLSLGFSATFEDGKSGYIGSFSDLSDKPLGLALGFNVQYYPWRPAQPEAGGTLSDIGEQKVAEIIALCRAEQAKDASALALRTEIFGASSTTTGAAAATTPAPSTEPCRHENLLRWTFATKADGTFKHPDAIDIYNAAFWVTPGKDELPKYGFGVTAEFTRQRFSFIDPGNFAPGILVPDADPPLLSTLDFDALGGDRKVTYDWFGGGYGFYHWPIDLTILEGLTLIGRGRYGRKWEIDKAAKDIEFCATDAPPASGVPIPGADNRTCEKFHIAAPRHQAGFEVTGEIRTLLPLTRLHRYLPEIGLGPSLGYSGISKRYRAVAPFYVAFDEDRGLNGGLQIAHEWGNGDNKETVISIFYSTPFTLAGNK
jgi:outer membrane murein-binding lipoprotein Lpp